MTPEQFRKAVAKGQAAPVYFFSGPEERQKRQALDALAGLVPAATRDFNVQVFHAFEADFAEVLTAARTLPLMASRRVVVLRGIEKVRLDQRGRKEAESGEEEPLSGRGELLAEYLAAPAPETIFVVTCEDQERARSLAKQHGERWTVVEFRALQGEALEEAVRAAAARLGCGIEDEALAALLGATGADLALAVNELEKLRAALGEGGTVDLAAVRRFVAGYEQGRSFDVVDALGRRDLPAALRLLNGMTIDQKEFLGLLGQIGKRLRMLWYLAGGEREVPKEFNAGWQLPKLRADARRFSRAEIERGLDALLVLDDRVKSTQVPPKLLLERFLLALLSR